MSVYGGPDIITDGLVLHLDAANTKSYPGTGTAWNDLSGNGNNTTLINGPIFSSINGGGISFDGTNDYAEATTRNTNLEFQPTIPYSCFLFLKTPPTHNYAAIIANLFNSSGYPGWDIFANGGSASNTIAAHLISSWSTNAVKVRWSYNFSYYNGQWVSLALTYDGSCPTTAAGCISSMNLYFNGSLLTSGKTNDEADGFNSSSETISYSSNQRFRVASRWWSGASWQQSDIETSVVLLYNNKLLSADEISSNYNALKGRFGL